MLKDYIGTTEASARYGVSIPYITLLLREGKVEGRKLGAKIWMLNAKDLERYLKTPRKKGRKPLDKD